MKRIFSFILAGVIVFCLSACNSQKSSFIEPTEWGISTIQSVSDGTVIYCSKGEQEQFPEAAIKNIYCTIDGADIIIRDGETGEEWSGTYAENNVTEDRAIYDVTFGEEAGQIVNSLTKYEDDTIEDVPTLIISCGDYVLNFSIAYGE